MDNSFKDIPGFYNKYQINNYGVVKSIISVIILLFID